MHSTSTHTLGDAEGDSPARLIGIGGGGGDVAPLLLIAVTLATLLSANENASRAVDRGDGASCEPMGMMPLACSVALAVDACRI